MTRGLEAHLGERWGVAAGGAADLADRLVGAAVFPYLSRALFGLETLRPDMSDEAALEHDVDLTPVRTVVREALAAAR